MATLQDQLLWEAESAKRGAQTYWDNQKRLRKNSEGDKTEGVSYLLQERMQEVADLIEERMKMRRGRGAKYNSLLVKIAQEDYLKLAFIGLQVIFQKTAMVNQGRVLRICMGIGIRLEADLKCQMFEATHPAYYNTVMKSLKEQRVTDYMHKHKVFMTKFNDFEDLEWENLEPEVHAHLGLRVVDAILIVFNDIFYVKKRQEGIKTPAYIETTDSFDVWLSDFEQVRGLMNPMKLPLKIPPRAWDRQMRGGYYTPEVADTVQFIKTKSHDHRKYIAENVPTQHRKAINSMQRTPWMINKRVFAVQQEIYAKGLGVGIPSNVKIVPVPFPAHLATIPKDDLTESQRLEVTAWKIGAKLSYGEEQDRKANTISFMQSFKLAKELSSWDEFYYVYTADFRGRIYCATAGLSPQGTDSAKGVLQFARSEKLGTDGVKWLAVQGANVYGNDKLSYAERVSWIRENEQHIRQAVEDPVGTRDFWANADKPYQFLSFCFEWSDCDYGRNKNAFSSIPVGLDGSCNGLQHFSAMLRDEVGASATNLSQSERPQDIYKEVADATSEAIKALDEPWANKWGEVGIVRKVAKQPVMTLPYGAKQKSARAAIFKWVRENWDLFNLDEKHQWEISKWLTPHMWDAIGRTVVAAREAMDWLQKNVGNDYNKWLTPILFPVYQYYKDVPVTVVRTKLCGMTELKLADLDRYGDPLKSRQRSGIAPNFVHSIDSTHMVMTINMVPFKCLAMIHDDFGTHAGNTQQLFDTIRKSFHKLYTEHDPLLEWAEQTGVDVDTMPTKGTYNIDDILTADYFFG